ncbi:hypothetical protein ACJMK2_033934 [Sinanodonta woodiana]|uniref:Ribosomal protein L27 n=1 Tax=Sinanodonta woodiana TaxID=1069815 RepID=A0ABD3WPZ5_SINWO
MAALIARLSSTITSTLQFLQAQAIQGASIRFASKKVSGTSRNKRSRTRGKARGLKVRHNEFVHSGQTLVTQLGLRYYPGENVGIKDDNTLYALRDGKMLFSAEKLTPYPDSPLYERVKKGVVIYKRFMHIYPIPLHGKFRLVKEV